MKEAIQEKTKLVLTTFKVGGEIRVKKSYIILKQEKREEKKYKYNNYNLNNKDFEFIKSINFGNGNEKSILTQLEPHKEYIQDAITFVKSQDECYHTPNYLKWLLRMWSTPSVQFMVRERLDSLKKKEEEVEKPKEKTPQKVILERPPIPEKKRVFKISDEFIEIIEKFIETLDKTKQRAFSSIKAMTARGFQFYSWIVKENYEAICGFIQQNLTSLKTRDKGNIVLESKHDEQLLTDGESYENYFNDLICNLDVASINSKTYNT